MAIQMTVDHLVTYCTNNATNKQTASLYSFVAITYLQQHAVDLKAHGVEIDYHPVLIGGLNAATKNSPPWLVPAKRVYLEKDMSRALAHVGLPSTIHMPPDFVEKRARTLLPMRVLVVCKHVLADKVPEQCDSAVIPLPKTRGTSSSSQRYIAVFDALFRSFWIDQHYLNDPEVLAHVLGTVHVGREKVFRSEKDVRAVMEAATGSVMAKDELRRSTDEALKSGAFGCPWIVATKGSGNERTVFWGSDRWRYIWEYLELPFRDVELLSPRTKL